MSAEAKSLRFRRYYEGKKAAGLCVRCGGPSDGCVKCPGCRSVAAVSAERFWSRVNRDAPAPMHVDGIGPCWLWTGPTVRVRPGCLPYGIFSGHHTHRISWHFTHGEIPAGMHVLHRCDNPPCVNPAHLFLGNDVDNSRDKVAKQRQARGERHGNAKLTADAVRAIVALKGRSSPSVVAAEYGVSRQRIDQIWDGAGWRHLEQANG